ncbi:hypothetical protein [Flavobacterium sp. N2038]|uniref:hypothetical protein n=1 Tax=Flavobacterium sp. N2038 TaxID=2986829 RepID=UPI0022259C80|nr:hypothetical protein [Flavobacterium sp. N2038]
MTTEYYLNWIKDLHLQYDRVDSSRAELENLVLKISQNTTETGFTLNTFFDRSNDIITSINIEIVNLFAKSSGLVFLDEKESGNVCFANSQEIRSEYRQSFRLLDFLDYINAFMHSSVYRESQKIIIPSETDLFWQMVKMGTVLREEIN